MKLFYIHILTVAEVVILFMIHMPKLVFKTKQKHMNVKVFNLMSRVNKTRFTFQDQSCECKCGLI